MSDAADQVNDQALFAAREFVARIERETGGKLLFDPAVVQPGDHSCEATRQLAVLIRERMLFAFEMGYLRGHGDGMFAAGALYDEIRKKVFDEPK